MTALAPIEISYPFSINAVSGSIGISTDYVKTAEDHIVSVLGTRFGERVMRPKYGSSIDHSFYDVTQGLNETLLIDTIKTALSEWEPGVEIIDINFVNKVRGDGESAISINIGFRVRGYKTLSEYSPVYTAAINLGGTPLDSRNPF